MLFYIPRDKLITLVWFIVHAFTAPINAPAAGIFPSRTRWAVCWLMISKTMKLLNAESKVLKVHSLPFESNSSVQKELRIHTRKLGVYHADDAGGFSVKGTCVTNYTESKSISKTVRKPGEMLPEVLKAGKIALRNVLTGIATKESLLTGRLNKDVVLLRVL